ncbi:Lytic transglycosylase, catalytic [Candidatus Koribacter versatilis Ellin345]|uniref:Lytic transglycosylase, catalytic n=1 Tax=Koribacter versatilis (strain Ellin345) TaxID=204669 RepID=Q1IN58_KORVE|nr:Lytic transglycosylase, catalytic [Candidatus Koribacter versatilis Ellin345]
MHLRFFVLAVLALALLPGAVHAQDTTSSSDKSTTPTKKKTAAKKSTTAKSSSKSSTAKKKTTASTAHKKATSRKLSHTAALRMNKTFVASADLKPMATQLISMRTPAAYDGVEKWTALHSGTDAGALGYLVLGYSHLQDRKYPQAIAELKKAQPRAGELSDYVDFFLGQAYAGNADYESALVHLRDFNVKYAESLYAHDALIAFANACLNASHPSEAIKALEANRAPTKADTELALGRAYIKNGQEVKGGLILQHIYYTMPTSVEADAAEADMRKVPGLPAASLDDRLTRADLLLKGKQYTQAAADYRGLMDVVSGDRRSEVLANLAVSLMKSGATRDAQKYLDQIPATAAAEINGQKLYNEMMIARHNNDSDRVASYLSQLRQQASTSSFFQEALFEAGNMYMLQHDYDHSIDCYREIHERFPEGPRAAYAHWRASWFDLRQGRTDAALREFREQLEKYPSTTEVTAAMYWEARLLEEKGNLPAARAWYAKLSDRYRNYYYAILARERLRAIGVQNIADEPLLAKVKALPPLDPSQIDTTPPPDDLRMEKARLLENGGMIDFAVKELQAVPGAGSGNWASLQVARIYTDAGQPHRALQYLKKTVPSYTAQEIGTLPVAYWKALFPRPYWADVQRFAEENNLDPFLVAALIRQESEFNPGAVSYANAYGLMQLLPGTGKSMAKTVGMKKYNTAALLQPSTNIELGTRYFRDMSNKLGNVEYALAAYNAGSDRVADWRDSAHYRDIAEFVETIPFVQTRDYVQSIVRNAAIYRRLYSTNTAPTKSASTVAEKAAKTSEQ